MKQFKTVFFVLLAIFIFSPLNNTAASPAQDQLKGSIDNILETLRDPSLKGDENRENRRASLRKIIYKRFSFAKMSQLCLGRHWRKRSDEEKKVFIEMFGQLLEESYVSRIESYKDETVVFLKEDMRGNKAKVYTKIITDTIEIPMDYRMYKREDGQWMVYDLVVEGVSLVGNYRSQFDQILHRDPYEKLVETIKKKLAK